MKRPSSLSAALVLCLLASAPSRADDGDLDESFSGDGKQTIAFDHGQDDRDRGQAVTGFGSGRIVVVGDKQQVNAGDTDIGVVALTPSGALDETFGNLGTTSVYFDLGGDNEDRSTAVAAMKDGRFVLCGTAKYQGTSNWMQRLVVARFLASGFIDPSFGPFDDGKVVLTPFNHPDTYVHACKSIVVQDDGKIVVPFQSDEYFETGLIRLEEDGDLDPTFGGDGISEMPFCPTHETRCEFLEVLPLPGGKYMAIGTRKEVAGELDVQWLFFARYTSSGLLDTSFSGDGQAIVGVPPGSVQDEAHLPAAAALDPQGRIVVLERLSGVGVSIHLLVRIDANGNVDPTFSGDGWQQVAWIAGSPRPADGANGLIIQGDGKLIVTGFHPFTATDFDCVAMRFTANAASLDASFGSNGRRFIAFDMGLTEDTDKCHGVSAADGRPLLAGEVMVQSDLEFGVARLTNAYIFIDGFEIGSRFFWSDTAP